MRQLRQIPKNRIGRVERAIFRALVTAGDRPLLTINLLEHAYPRVVDDRYRRWHYKSVYRAARKFAVNVAGPGRAFIIWGPKPELAEKISADDRGNYCTIVDYTMFAHSADH